jgi:hypothetical protein
MQLYSSVFTFCQIKFALGVSCVAEPQHFDVLRLRFRVKILCGSGASLYRYVERKFLTTKMDIIVRIIFFLFILIEIAYNCEREE